MDTQNQVKRVSPREVFLHLLAIITLYASAASFVTLLFQYTDILIPDPLFSGESYYPSHRGPLRFSVASLIVVFPVYLVVSWFLNRSYLADAALRERRLRKWLIYFTLFAAALIMIGDLVALVYNLLGGEFTARFILKAAALFATAGAVFWYYLSDVRREAPLPSLKAFVWGVSCVVGVAVVGAFFLVGSPAEERLRRFDDQRVSDLRGVQWEVVNYWRARERLPETLEDLTDELRGYRAPMDPEEKEKGIRYEYRVMGPLAFELCAVFNLPSRPPATSEPMRAEPKGFVEEVWDHGTGRTCFSRTIDPERYLPFSKEERLLPAPR